MTPEGADQECDLLTINDRDRQIGSNQVLSSNSKLHFEMSEVVVILDSIWRDDTYFTFIDNLNRIINVNLQPNSNQKHLQILCGHDVVMLKYGLQVGRSEQFCMDERSSCSNHGS